MEIIPLFRIFDKKNNSYVKEELFLSPDGESLIDEFGNYHNIEHFEIQRCVGKKDTTGKFIYEGDRVYIPDENWRAYVIFYYGRLYLEDGKGGYDTRPVWEGCTVIESGLIWRALKGKRKKVDPKSGIDV